MSRLRGYQVALKNAIYEAWQSGAQTVVGVTATGSGKTYTMSAMAHELQGFGVIMAHRSELVGQISMALASDGVRHNITASKATVKTIVEKQMRRLGKSFYDPRAAWNVQSVDTIIRRSDPLAAKVSYVFTDEGHHVLRENKWGRGIAMYPNAKALLMTATPTRADGKGLGAHADGLADAMVIGPGLKELIANGYLTNYNVYTPDLADLDLSDVHIGPSGEFNQQEAARAIKRSRKIVGDVVHHYQKIVPGKQAIVFAADIEHAHTLADAFVAAGIKAAMLDGNTDEAIRTRTMEQFEDKQFQVLVNVDLFGEGVDVPGVEVIIMARLTASFALMSQMVGRMLRLLISPVLMAAWDTYTVAQRLRFIAESDKPFGVLIDHVGNVRREYNVGGFKYSGLPEGFTAWSLDSRKRRPRGPADDAIPMRVCASPTCRKPYERIYDTCPYCGQAAPEPADRSTPQAVDGDLTMLDGEVLARMRGEIAKVDGRAYVPQGVPAVVGASILKNHAERQREQGHLRTVMAVWAGMYRHDSDSVNYKRFLFNFGIDAGNAQTLGAREAAELATRIRAKIAANSLPPLPKL